MDPDTQPKTEDGAPKILQSIEEEKALTSHPAYHGFLPREDIARVLKSTGDYLIRVSEVENNKDQGKMKREIVLSVYADVHTGEGECSKSSHHSHHDDGTTHKSMRKNIVMKYVGKKYFIENNQQFDSVLQLTNFYETNVGTVNKTRFMLKTAVKLMDWELQHSNLTLGKVLGQGAFGEVRAAKWKKGNEEIEVAVKLTKGTNDLCKAKIKEMMREARFMRDLKHKNVVGIHGIAVLEQPLYIILELIKGGALNSYLVANKGKVSKKEKLDMCFQAALGLEYLHVQRCIHRDIAARNCLYSEDKITKISDFGLSRNGTQYVLKTKIKLPIKWLAPETLVGFVFTPKSDVYSFGVLIYEIFADGAEPWEGQRNSKVQQMVTSGQQLTMPKDCPDKMKAYLSQNVFSKDPKNRTTMTEVVKFFDTCTSQSCYMAQK